MLQSSSSSLPQRLPWWQHSSWNQILTWRLKKKKKKARKNPKLSPHAKKPNQTDPPRRPFSKHVTWGQVVFFFKVHSSFERRLLTYFLGVQLPDSVNFKLPLMYVILFISASPFSWWYNANNTFVLYCFHRERFFVLNYNLTHCMNSNSSFVTWSKGRHLSVSLLHLWVYGLYWMTLQFPCTMSCQWRRLNWKQNRPSLLPSKCIRSKAEMIYLLADRKFSNKMLKFLY